MQLTKVKSFKSKQSLQNFNPVSKRSKTNKNDFKSNHAIPGISNVISPGYERFDNSSNAKNNNIWKGIINVMDYGTF
jgi:hypothetical protein